MLLMLLLYSYSFHSGEYLAKEIILFEAGVNKNFPLQVRIYIFWLFKGVEKSDLPSKDWMCSQAVLAA